MKKLLHKFIFDGWVLVAFGLVMLIINALFFFDVWGYFKKPKTDVIKIQDDDPIIECVASGDCYRVYRDTTTQTLYLYATESGTFTIMKDLNGNIRFYEGK